MNHIDWPGVAKLPWRQRNAHVERAVRTCLASTSRVWDTMTLAQALYPIEHCDPVAKLAHAANVAKLAQCLAKMAPYMGALATHDGEKIVRYGRQWRRWNWHGQKH